MGFMVMVRGTLKMADLQAARAAHDEVFGRLAPRGKELGSTAHRTYLSVEDPKQFVATDFWPSVESIQEFSADPGTNEALASLFEEPPTVTVWAATDWAGF